MIASTHPALSSTSARRGLVFVLLVRIVLFAALIFGLDELTEFGTSATALSAGAALGIIAATQFAFSSVTALGFGALLGGAYLAYTALFAVLGGMGSMLAPGEFTIFNWQTHANLIGLSALISAISTWGFWRFRHTMTLEVLLLGGTLIYLFSGHRNFRFDTSGNTPQLLNSLAWSLGIDHLSMLVLIGGVAALSLIVYGFLSTIPSKPTPRLGLVYNHPGSRGTVAASALTLCLGLALAIAGSSIYRYYAALARERTMNGVGLSTQEGLTPLSFQSALGSTNQPAALVRLEGDYGPNPFTPMLYLREAALSSFNGKEIVQATRLFDQDVALTTPKESFSADEDATLTQRVPLGQSMYLLAEHKVAFALDYPLSIRPLTIPGNKRFKAAYRALSAAPAFNLEEIREAAVGDPRWTAETRAHYLVQHADPRYGQLALEVTKDALMPVEKAAALVEYLSKKAIYTLTPNHKVEPHEDPVAPFLFGDMRGYCVHFAHAVTYMLRSLDIPSRIATGYLTDLSQSKDGHVLLRMSDRHAWAEVFVAGYGWVPFDVQPEQVESHGDTQVDMKLLEELMGSLEPGEEILPKDIARDEPRMDEPSWTEKLHPGFILWLVVALIVSGITLKVYLRFGWILPGSPAARLRRSARATLSTLYDLGYRRRRGETRQEFRRRLLVELGASPLDITAALTPHIYAPNAPVDLPEVLKLHRHDRTILARAPRYRRLLSLLNPASILATLTGERW